MKSEKIFRFLSFCFSGSIISNVLSVTLFMKELIHARHMLSQNIPTGKLVLKVILVYILAPFL